MCAQMRNFLDQTGGHWMSGALVGSVDGARYQGKHVAQITTRLTHNH